MKVINYERYKSLPEVRFDVFYAKIDKKRKRNLIAFQTKESALCIAIEFKGTVAKMVHPDGEVNYLAIIPFKEK